MSPSRLPTGSSDPISYTCNCAASDSQDDGLILLFYRYFSASPALPSSFSPQANDPSLLASFHKLQASKLNLTGKIRIAKEGFNITVGGTKASIEEYKLECTTHWSFSELPLSSTSQIHEFFKPTPGCACAFPSLSVQVKGEITPLGVTNYSPSTWDSVTSLTPAEFHARCWQSGGGGEKVLLDVRNHYESRIGYFIDPVSGEKAITPDIRRFSQWPMFVRKHLTPLQPPPSQTSLPKDPGEEEEEEAEKSEGREKSRVRQESNSNPKEILSYCTGGIRCEKGIRWMAETAPLSSTRISTLKGGIAAYLAWIDAEIAAGRMTAADSLFKGRNYVFDARGSTGLRNGGDLMEKVARCHVCGVKEDRMGKCRSSGCHLVLVVCGECDATQDTFCCRSCREFQEGEVEADGQMEKTQRRPICDCEKDREARLWGGESVKVARRKPQRQKRRTVDHSNGHDIDIQINTIT